MSTQPVGANDANGPAGPAEGDSGPVPRSLFTTTGLAPRDRFPAWAESISVLFDVMPGPRQAPPEFHSSVESFLLGPMVLGETASGGQFFERSRARVAVDGIDHYLIQVYREGMEKRGEDGTLARPGDLLVIDCAQPTRTQTTAFRNLTLVVPRPMLAGGLADPEAHQHRVIPGTTPMATLVREHVLALSRTAPDMTAKEARLATTPTVDLIAAALNGAHPAEAHEMPAGLAAVRMAICRHIDSHLAEPALTVESLPRDLGLSRASLYRAMEPMGGVAAYIRSRRLERCLRELIDPKRSHRRIADIAWDWGFTDQTAFSRAFRREFGFSPREARETGGIKTHSAKGRDRRTGDRRYETWLRDLVRGR